MTQPQENVSSTRIAQAWRRQPYVVLDPCPCSLGIGSCQREGASMVRAGVGVASAFCALTVLGFEVTPVGKLL